MSASSRPTRLPCCANASARLTAIVVLPTPPLPAPTAMMFFTPGNAWRWPGHGATAAHARRHLDVHGRHARQRGHGLVRLLLQQILDRAGRGGELDGERHAPVLADDDVLDEIERHDVAAQVGVLHHAQRVEDLGNRGKAHKGILRNAATLRCRNAAKWPGQRPGHADRPPQVRGAAEKARGATRRSGTPRLERRPASTGRVTAGALGRSDPASSETAAGDLNGVRSRGWRSAVRRCRR